MRWRRGLRSHSREGKGERGEGQCGRTLTPALVVSTISVTMRFARTVAISESYRHRLKYLAIEWLVFRWIGTSKAAA